MARVATTTDDINPIINVVLIADDHAPFRGLVRSLFSSETTHFIECGDGEAAVRAYSEKRPNWVLMDVEMKGMSGLKATRLIKDKYPEARVIIVTQYDDHDLCAKAGEAGACAFILKDNIADLRRYLNATRPA